MTPLIGEPTPLPPPWPAEIIAALEAARQLLTLGHQLAKHTAGVIIDGRPCYCIVAAITITSRTTQIRDACMDATRRALPWRMTCIQTYNDAGTTTLEDAKTLLWRAKSNVGAVAA